MNYDDRLLALENEVFVLKEERKLLLLSCSSYALMAAEAMKNAEMLCERLQVPYQTLSYDFTLTVRPKDKFVPTPARVKEEVSRGEIAPP